MGFNALRHCDLIRQEKKNVSEGERFHCKSKYNKKEKEEGEQKRKKK